MSDTALVQIETTDSRQIRDLAWRLLIGDIAVNDSVMDDVHSFSVQLAD